ncbi:MAG TPA: hypothetical protein VNO30_04370 [Kofleriaceae bacterium]|nr:hypothetical protein [Kofleriaceae bacterium]
MLLVQRWSPAGYITILAASSAQTVRTEPFGLISTPSHGVLERAAFQRAVRNDAKWFAPTCAGRAPADGGFRPPWWRCQASGGTLLASCGSRG